MHEQSTVKSGKLNTPTSTSDFEYDGFAFTCPQELSNISHHGLLSNPFYVLRFQL